VNLLLDMNLSHRLCPKLEQAGYRAVHWSAVGSSRASDVELLNWARDNSYVVLTHDLDFGSILAATGGNSPSVVQIRRHDVFPETLARALLEALKTYRKELELGSLVVIDEAGFRVRVLPLADA
jgi:predicted nuclease of predicted toxin-antitoxin system